MEGLDVRKLDLWRAALEGEPDLYAIAARMAVIPDTTAAVIRYANSAYVGAARPVGTVLEAVIRVGSRAVASFAMAGVSRDLVDEWGSEEMWSEALVVGRASKVIGRLLGFPQNESEHLFVAGLFSGAGAMGLTAKDEGYVPWRRKMRRRRFGTVDLLARERQIYGVDHTQMAATLLEGWNLPTNIVAAVASHHSPVSNFDRAVWAAMTLPGGADANARCLEQEFEESMGILGLTDRISYVQVEANLFADATFDAYQDAGAKRA
jgi:HD-like signal output (HDOD) protein